MAFDTINEKLLFARLARKDKDAFIRFYDEYLDKIYRYIYFKVGTKEEAEDLTSSVFLKAWNSIQEGSISTFDNIKPYVYTIARNTVIDHYRKNAKQPLLLKKDENASMTELINGQAPAKKSDREHIDEKQNLEESLDRAMEFELVQKKLFELKDEYREVIILRYLEGLSTKEVAVITNKPSGSTRVLLHRALKALKELLDESR